MKPVLLFVAMLVLLSGCSLFDVNDDAPGDTAARMIAHQEEVVFLSPYYLNDGSPSDTSTQVIVDLEEGESRFLPPFNATLRFVEKQGDSRCPLGVDCFWEGEATILLELTPQSQPATSFTMTGFVGPDGEGEVVTDTLGLRFTLLLLDPYPVDGVPHDGPSTATLAIKRP